MHEPEIEELIDAARAVQGTFELTKSEFTAASVGAALRSASGAIFTGVSIHLACGVGFCAEHAAIAEMLKNREVEISTIVSVNANVIIPPCGRCRELMAQLSLRNGETRVVLPGGRMVALRDLLPEHWLGPWP
jgi:cytidine deaminase